MEVIPLDDRINSTTILNTASPSDALPEDVTNVYATDDYNDGNGNFNEAPILEDEDLPPPPTGTAGGLMAGLSRNKLLIALLAGSALLCAMATGGGVAIRRARVNATRKCTVADLLPGGSIEALPPPPLSTKTSKSPKSSKSPSNKSAGGGGGTRERRRLMENNYLLEGGWTGKGEEHGGGGGEARRRHLQTNKSSKSPKKAKSSKAPKSSGGSTGLVKPVSFHDVYVCVSLCPLLIIPTTKPSAHIYCYTQ